MCVFTITVTLYIQVGHILYHYKPSFSCHINELICILLHMRMNIIYQMCAWSNIKVEIAPILLRSVFYCLLWMKINVIPSHKSRKLHGFDLDKATIICIKIILLKDCIYMRVLFHFDAKLSKYYWNSVFSWL